MWLWVAVAGAAGALARWAVHGAVGARIVARLPWGTIVVNLSGSLLLGVVTGLVIAHGLDPDVRTIVGTGFLGAYTTYSAFAYETFALAEDGAVGLAVLNVVGSVAAGMAAATIGLAITGAL